MKNQVSILKNVYEDIELIDWSTDTVKQKAIKFVSNFINISVRKSILDDVQHLSQGYWKKVILGKTDHLYEVKKKLVENKILIEFVGKCKRDKRTKSYKLNPNYIMSYTTLILIKSPFSNNLDKRDLEITEENTINVIKELTVKDNYNLTNIINKEIETIKVINDEGYEFGVTSLNDYIDVKFGETNYRYKLENAIEYANNNNYFLIQYGRKKIKFTFVRDLDYFINFRKMELEIIYTKSLTDIKFNCDIYATINETNNRLDSNVTNLKSELWDFLELDNEKLVELDITNAQFAIVSYICKENNIDIEEDFIKLTQNGDFYESIAKELNLTRQEAKQLMFKLVFDKVRNTEIINQLRNKYPKFMSFVDDYKLTNGYKNFSILLQKTESNLMINNLLFNLQKEFKVLTVHDAIRCKESDKDKVYNFIVKYFETLNFKCKINIK